MKTKTKLALLLSILPAVVNVASAAVETYAIDPIHSSVGFTIRHFVSKVPGTFTKVAGSVVVDRDDLEKSSVTASIDANSFNTTSAKRDQDVKGPDFLDAAKFPAITFASKSWKKTGEGTFDVTGDLTIHGVTKEVVLKTTLLGFGEGMRGVKLSGWEVSTTLKKSDFGVNGPPMLGKVLGDDVTVTITIEADMKQG